MSFPGKRIRINLRLSLTVSPMATARSAGTACRPGVSSRIEEAAEQSTRDLEVDCWLGHPDRAERGLDLGFVVGPNGTRQANEPCDRVAVEFPHAAVVQDRDSALGREEQVPRVWVGVEEAMAVQRADVELVESARCPFACLGGWPRLKESLEACPFAPGGRQNPRPAPVQVDRRDGNRLMAREELDETGLAARLQRVVALLEEAGLCLLDDLRDVDARSKGSRHDLANGRCLEIGPDGGVNARMAHFHRHGYSVFADRAVDLANRGSGNGLAFDSGEQSLASRPKVLLDGALDLREGCRLGVALEHGKELARLGVEGSVHIGEDLPTFIAMPFSSPNDSTGRASASGESNPRFKSRPCIFPARAPSPTRAPVSAVLPNRPRNEVGMASLPRCAGARVAAAEGCWANRPPSEKGMRTTTLLRTIRKRSVLAVTLGTLLATSARPRRRQRRHEAGASVTHARSEGSVRRPAGAT